MWMVKMVRMIGFLFSRFVIRLLQIKFKIKELFLFPSKISLNLGHCFKDREGKIHTMQQK